MNEILYRISLLLAIFGAVLCFPYFGQDNPPQQFYYFLIDFMLVLFIRGCLGKKIRNYE